MEIISDKSCFKVVLDSKDFKFWNKIESNFIQICKDKKGTHTIQKMVDLATLPEEEEFFEVALQGEVAKLAVDQQGTHIIQKIIVSFAEQK